MKNVYCFSKVIFLLLIVFFSQCDLYAQNPSSLDPIFNIGIGPNGVTVYTSAIQGDQKIIVGGDFTSFNGTSKKYLIRLNTNGSVDGSFNNAGTGPDFYVYTSAVQDDGKIIIGGEFGTYNGIPRHCLARLNIDGSLDTNFIVGSGIVGNGVVTISIQNDGKIIIGGDFTSYNGTARSRIARLNTDGSIDPTFNVGTLNSEVSTTAIQNDGKIIIGGYFTMYNGISRNCIARLNSDGSLDASFNPGTGVQGTGLCLYACAIQNDEKIIIGGWFSTYNGIARDAIARLNRDGSLDSSFIPGTSGNNFSIHTIAIQGDEKIVIGGVFSLYKGTPINNIARINVDGSLDASFNPGTGLNDQALTAVIQKNGKIIIGGNFTIYNGSTQKHLIRLQGDPTYYNTIRGTIYSDSNNDCNFQNSEKIVPSLIVEAFPGPYYGRSDLNGRYQVKVDSGIGTYTISQQYNSIQSQFLLNQCASSKTLSIGGSSKDTCCFNFADTAITQCSILNIGIQKTSGRQCIRSTTYVDYANYGLGSASGAVVKIEYPANIIPLTSKPGWSSIQGSILTYNIGTISGGQSNKILITDSVSCINGIAHQIECIKATISPSSNCVADNPAWDKSSMKVTGTCQTGNAHFTITNDGTGDMGSSLEYRVYENDTLVYTGNYKLNSGQSFTVDYPAAGQTIRVEADQHPLHPGKSHPRATVENCGTAISGTATSGFVTTAPLDDLDEEVAIGCVEITNSHDPNEKLAIPSGIGSAHNIAPGEEIEFVIGFQNTGSDTAHTVILVDTLDAGFDVSSFKVGASSHPYTLKVSGKGQAVLTFTFSQIKLPDSTTNYLASNGLVSYRVAIPSNAAIGTILRNKAYIFFDYNDPVLTNETMHTVDTVTNTNLSKGSAVVVGSVITGLTASKFNEAVRIYPNPTSGILTVEMPQAANSNELRILSLVGALQKSLILSSDIQDVSLEGLSEGMYLYEVWQNGERKAGGKLLKN